MWRKEGRGDGVWNGNKGLNVSEMQRERGGEDGGRLSEREKMVQKCGFLRTDETGAEVRGREISRGNDRWC